MTTETRESIDPRSDFAIGAVARMAARWVRASHALESPEKEAAVLLAGWSAALLLSFALPWDEALTECQVQLALYWAEKAQAADYIEEQLGQIIRLSELLWQKGEVR